MSYVPTWLLATMRTRTNLWLKDTCQIEQSSVTIGDLGDTIETWSVVSASTACRVIGAASSDTANVEGQEEMLDTFRIICPAGTALEAGQRITVASTGHVFQVSGVITDYTDELFTAAIAVRQR
jgi:hypothetical protein